MRQDRNLPKYTAEERRYFKRQVGEFVIIRGSTGEETLEAVLGIASRKVCGIIGLDSVNALLPQADADKSLDEETKRAARANLMTQFFAHYYRHSTGLDGLNPTTLIFTQQVRSNQDRANAPSYMQRYIPDYTVTGARATKHGKLIDIMVKSGEKLTKTTGGVKHIIGKELKWEITKGKAGAHDNVYGATNFYYDRGVDRLETVLETGQRFGVLVAGSDGIYSIRPETGEATDMGAPDMGTLRRLMEVDFELELAIRREILATAGIKCIYR
jgi:RecA/RadA recombinase